MKPPSASILPAALRAVGVLALQIVDDVTIAYGVCHKGERAMPLRFHIVCTLLIAAATAACSSPNKPPKADMHLGPSSSAESVSPLAALMREAQAGDAKAQHTLAVKYLRGDGIAMNLALSVQWERKSAEQGYAAAQAQLDDDDNRGIGVPAGTETNSWTQNAAVQGDVRGQRNLGLTALNKVRVHMDRRPDLQPPLWSSLREATDADFKPVPPSVTGNGVSAAIDLFQKAAAQGDAKAETYLGRIYADGKLMHQDATKSIDWFRKAAAQGEAYAQWVTSICYTTGDGCRRDAAKAAEWYQKAWASNDADGQWAIGDCYQDGGACSKDLAKALVWYERAASHGDVTFQWQIGSCYGNGGGWGCVKNPAKAVKWYEMAAARGDPYLQRRLGECYRVGSNGSDGCPIDYAKSAVWLQKAADQGDEIAERLLGEAYQSGSGVVKDAGKAAELYRKAAIQGDSFAQLALAALYYSGNGVARNWVLAYAWVDIAAVHAGPDSDRDAKIRDRLLERQMTPAQINEAQRLASNWKPGADLPQPSDDTSTVTDQKAREHLTKHATGTAFVVNQAGLAVTNEHVVHGCSEMRLQGSDGVVKVLATDVANDLALMQLPDHPSTWATIAGTDQLRQGDDITVFGFPLNGTLTSGGNLTTGVISGLTGMRNNTAQFQITAAIQPGSSGSPVMNDHGDVIGVVLSKLSDAVLAKALGEVGETVNFAIRGQELKAFLDANRVAYKTDNSSWFSHRKNPADIADAARKWTVIAECWK